MIANYAAVFAALSVLTLAGPVYRRVGELDQDAVDEAHQRDDTATRAFSNTTIKTSSGKCLFVDELSGDSTANLTPIQVAACGATAGQGFDVITQGKHNDAVDSILIVSTLTQACFTFDPAQDADNQVMLYSCGGVADGSGNVTTSQLFAGDGTAGPLSLAPQNQAGSCFTVKGNSVTIADCDDSDDAQTFTFEGVASDSVEDVETPASSSTSTSFSTTSTQATESAAASETTQSQLITATCEPVTVTETEVLILSVTGSAASIEGSSSSTDTTTTTTLFITVGPTSSANEELATSSTTTVFITVSPPSATEPSSAVSVTIPVNSSSAAPASTGASSSKTSSDPNTIPQISINPSTTVLASGTAAPTASSPAAIVSSAIEQSSAAPTTTAASSKTPSDPNTIPQISINPSTTVVASGTKPTASSSAAIVSSATKLSSTTPVTTAAPSSKAPSNPNTIPQISINPSTTVVVST
ncbi:hypothetical protein AB5N19_06683 [Seiridium cardinale]